MNYKASSYKAYTEQGLSKNCLHNKDLLAQTDERYQYIHYCYSSTSVRNMDYLMVEQGYVDNSYELMKRAAQSLWKFIVRNYSHIEHMTIVCGTGNNAGDGYALGCLAKTLDKEPNVTIQLISLIDPEQLSGDANLAYQDWLDCGGQIDQVSDNHFQATDLIIDALVGTGLNRALEGEWYDVVELINHTPKPVLSVDIPSGLDANTGACYSNAINANHTITFIAQKMGMYTAQARYYCGEIHFASLGVDDKIYQESAHDAILMEWSNLAIHLPCRSPISHKGDHGHLLIIGGDYGMSGACRIAGEAALRSGTGLVSIATRMENVNAITSARPELMVHGIDRADDLAPLLAKANTIAIGPGLGTKQWGIALLDKVIKHLKQLSPDKASKIRCIFDADALNIMAQHNMVIQSQQIVYTPHFSEACRLLKYTPVYPTDKSNRFDMITKLKAKYYGTFVLKGAGTLVTLDEDISICPYGNAGMASAGMGDCLTGVIGALLAQNLELREAVQLAV